MATWAAARWTSSSGASPALKSRRVRSSVPCCAARFWFASAMPLLEAPVGDVLETHLAHQRDQHRVPVVLRRLDARVGGFHRAAVPTEDVHLPVRVEARLEEIEHLSRASCARGRSCSFARACTTPTPRPAARGRPPQIRRERARLAHPGLGLLQGEVRLHGPRDERRQELVVEGGPPCRRDAVRDGVTAPAAGAPSARARPQDGGVTTSGRR